MAAPPCFNRSMRSARPAQGEFAARTPGNSHLPAISTWDCRDLRAPRAFDFQKPRCGGARDAVSRMRERRTRYRHLREDIVARDVRQDLAAKASAGTFCGSAFSGISFEHQMDRAAAFKRTDFRVKRLKRPQFQNMLRVNRVGIAQPSFDLGDGQCCAGARSSWRKRGFGRGSGVGLLPREYPLLMHRRGRASELSSSRSARPNPFVSCFSRSIQREATVGAPSAFSERVRITRGPAASVAKSCAASPDAPFRRFGNQQLPCASGAKATGRRAAVAATCLHSIPRAPARRSAAAAPRAAQVWKAADDCHKPDARRVLRQTCETATDTRSPRWAAVRHRRG